MTKEEAPGSEAAVLKMSCVEINVSERLLRLHRTCP